MAGPPSSDAIATYREFWPYYLGEHAKTKTRAWHIFGTSAALLSLFAAVVLAQGWLVLAALVFGYGPAWAAHFLVEKNRPATFRYPVWSLLSDLRMTLLWFAGGLDENLKKAPPARPSAPGG